MLPLKDAAVCIDQRPRYGSGRADDARRRDCARVRPSGGGRGGERHAADQRRAEHPGQRNGRLCGNFVRLFSPLKNEGIFHPATENLKNEHL